MKRIIRIVLTGGPCGGKSTALAYLYQKLSEKGFIVLIVPEAATLCIGGKISPINPIIGVVAAQRAIMRLAYDLEENWLATAKGLESDKPIIIIYDRGIPDGSAYAEAGLYESLLGEWGLHKVEARDSRYDAVIHLRTAADGAEAFYTTANNAARYETPEQARRQDVKTADAWIGHPHFRAIGNETDFAGKMHVLYQEVCAVIGIPIPIEFERRFLVSVDRSKLPTHAQRVQIEQQYLMSPNPDTIIRVRKRGQHGFFTYYQTIKQPIVDEVGQVETEKGISAQEYIFGASLKDPTTDIVRKDRTCFVDRNQYFELDDFERSELLGGKSLLEIELTDKAREVVIPEGFKVEREVTGDKTLSNHAIAKWLYKNPGVSLVE